MTLRESCCYGANRMLHKSRRYLLLFLGVLALGYFFYKFRNSITLEGFHWGTVAQSLGRANLPLLILSVLSIYVCYAIRSLRWMRFTRTLGGTHFSNVFRATLMGFACTFLLGRAGEPVRPVLIARKDSLSIPRMFGVYVLERVFDMAAAIVLAGSSLLLFERRGLVGGGDSPLMHIARPAGAALLVGLVAIVGFLIYFRYHGAAWLAVRLQHQKWRTGWREKIAVLLEGFSDGLQGIRTWTDLGVLVAYTVLHWLLVILVYFWVAHAFGGTLADLGFAAATLVLAFTLVGSAAQFPGIGGGAQFATFFVLTLVFGIEKEPAAVMAIVVWLVSFASCCLAGVPLLIHEGWSMGDLRRMAREEERAGEAALLAEAEQHASSSREMTR
ncbi:MAG TPA: lysylphosphatidylglycerol synthase transmembrane domain-containing protein [Candidatus Acidoferrales bacterium]|nr:lysylphosphatidylglycerol synthase transmembrane domain-containing protein [Candidatus Acidoferrales bacterium]